MKIRPFVNRKKFGIVLHNRKMDNAIRKLQLIPGVGPKLAKEFLDIGIRDVADFIGKNPENLHRLICAKHGMKVDRY